MGVFLLIYRLSRGYSTLQSEQWNLLACCAPQLSSVARQLRTDGRPVEQRMLDWHEAKQAKLADAAAASITAERATPPTDRRRRSGDPQFSGGKARTVDSF